MADTSRDYQTLSLNLIRAEFEANRTRVLLWLATGAGKTFIFCLMIKQAVERGMRCMVLVRGRKLVDQASKRLLKEGVIHGVMMARHWNWRPKEMVQVCSIDTLIARSHIQPEADLIIIDEADQAVSKGYKDFLALDKYSKSFIVAVTATPWVKDSLRHVADSIIHPITMEELIEQKYLCGFRYFAPNHPDVSKVKINKSTGDYNQEELSKVMLAGQLTGNIIEHWKALAENRPTICFAVNVKHSMLLAERFLEAGIAAEHRDASSTDQERNELIERVENGITKIVCNVGIFGRGVDIPRISCIIGARPTQSRNLFIQSAGRGARTFPGKEYCLYLDHAGNISRHGFPTDEPEVSLDGERPAKQSPRESKTCKNCFAVFRAPTCPECGVIAPPSENIIEEMDGELIELNPHENISPIQIRLKELKRERTKNRKTMSWVYWKLEKEFGQQAKELQPNYLTDAFSASPYSWGVKRDFIKKRKSAEGNKT